LGVLRVLAPIEKVEGMSKTDSNRIIYQAKNSSEALRGLYEFEKATNKSKSLAYYCKRAGIPSTGYLSDVLSGKRTVNVKYRIAIVRAFDLSAEAAASLRLLIDIDNESDPDRIKTMKNKLSATKKALKVTHFTLPTETRDLFTALDVFCAFGLFGNRPTKSQLEHYFQSGKEHDVTRSLQLLESLGLISTEGDVFCLLHEHVIFGSQEGRLSHVEFLKMAIAHAAENVTDWFEQKEKAYFTSSVVSVRKEKYAGILQDIRTKMLVAQSDLESDNADMLVRFNVQIYPILQPSLAR